jgi:L-amino acid N-acyltransferase YncA
MPRMIRLATSADAAAIQAIYAPVVRETAISFEVEPPAVAEMQQRIAKIQALLPWLVCEQGGAVQGYAYASRHRERAAYQWAVDVSVYIHPQWRGQGVGRALYDALFAGLRALGYYTVCASITLPNPASVGLHEAMGLAPIGIYRRIGYKLGAWHDVGWWQGALQPTPDQPPPPRALGDVLDTPEWPAFVAHGAAVPTER